MTTPPVTPPAAREVLDGVIREELLAAWERGLQTAPHGVNALADRGARDAFTAITDAVDAYAGAIARCWRDRLTAPAASAGTVPPDGDTAEAAETAADLRAVASDGGVAVVHCTEAWTFAPGHRMRAGRCLACREPIGDQPATVVGAAALAAEVCTCSAVPADVFLIHAGHLPMAAAALRAAIEGGLRCDEHHW